MRKWFVRTFPTLAEMEWPKLAMLPLVLALIFSIAVGITSPLIGRAEFGDGADVIE